MIDVLPKILYTFSKEQVSNVRGYAMNARENLILDNQLGRIITTSVDSCRYNGASHKLDVRFFNGKTYSYNPSRITWLRNPKEYDPNLFQISHSNKRLYGISAIYLFHGRNEEYWHICFENGREQDFKSSDLTIAKSCLDNRQAKTVLDYLTKIANEVSLKTENGIKLLSKQFDKITAFVDSDTVLAAYLNPVMARSDERKLCTLIFPFGCNASQFEAVKAAMENRISIIQGPPGTGKTQTILNIIANLLIAGKTVQVVSNNNSATANVFEKLSSAEYGLGFLAALLGREENKKEFLDNQSGCYPNVAPWRISPAEANRLLSDINARSAALHDIFSDRERLAIARHELEEIKTEHRYFVQYQTETVGLPEHRKTRKLPDSGKIMSLWQECLNCAEREKKPSVFFKLKSRFLFGFFRRSTYDSDLSEVIRQMQGLFYQAKESELSAEMAKLESDLASKDADRLSAEFSRLSMLYLKGKLAERYGISGERKVFSEEDLWRNPGEIMKEYPVVLSTAFSARSSICKEAIFDYLIMDEASQVDVATGALAVSSARNAVIVGDTKQLPNVVPEDVAKKTDDIFRAYHVRSSYSFAGKSFLQSVCEIFPNAPMTLLREHYRCHPKIIEFCNQKFYGGKLVIMTEDRGEKDVLTVIKTVKGNHARDHMNQRQIDSVKKEILPNLSFSPESIGIIAPYNAQVNAMKEALTGTQIEIATVHKFQGREKDAIILTTVDNVVTDFSDDPYLLNVAVSRAKKKLCLVVSGNEHPSDSNIADLISYIEYQNFSVEESKVYSIFDYLYSQYTESRRKYLSRHRRVSEYDSENLMYVLIQDTIKEKELSYLGVVCHFPMNMLIRDPKELNDAECRYAMNSGTHLDFLIYNSVSKKPVLAVEVDGFHFHKKGTAQHERDLMKDKIMKLYGIPLIRFSTNGSNEKERLAKAFDDLV